MKVEAEYMPVYLSGEEKQATRTLWEEMFAEDSRSFLDYYYREKLRDNRVLAIRESGELEAMLHLNPYVVCARGRRWRVDYLVGVATRREKRHHGYMSRLLLAMMADMRSEKAPFCFLMPADEAIYRPFGFTWIFRQPRWRLRKEEEIQRIPFMEPDVRRNGPGYVRRVAELADWMNRFLAARYQLHTVRDEAYLRRLLREIASENGRVDLLYHRETMVGIRSEWGWKRREQRFLYCDDAYTEEVGEPKPAIMARIITPEEFVRAVRLAATSGEKERQIRLHLTDPLIPENNGVWDWYLNRQTSWLVRADEAAPDQEQAACADELRLTVTELTQWLFGYDVPEAARPFADVVDPPEGVFLDEVV
ncbi:MAG: GNAT family N-acetyltransferase [Clostridiales bacterium]|nr:GNAT family N-acetyltransferase [Clostridiales bacterium]